MKLLTSKIPPLNNWKYTFKETFFDNLSKSDNINIASGYISTDSLVELHGIFSRISDRHIDLNLTIGMHYFEGITRPQFEAAQKLNELLKAKRMGSVSVVRDFKFHGKIYFFKKSNFPFSAIIGSSNLDNISDSHTDFEADLFADNNDLDVLNQINDFLNNYLQASTIPFQDWKPDKFISTVSPLEGYSGVTKITPERNTELKKTKTQKSLTIPLKAESKSNLNVFFGKGRVNKTGLVIPRPWYEVEIIVPIVVTQHDFYPRGKFSVFTNDCWHFDCKTSGANYKNLRSCEDLQILGRWIKGQLEAAGVIKPEDLITENALDSFKKNKLLLTQTNIPGVWYMELIE